MVINYDFPSSSVSYIHRIGRTGRAGHQGLAVTFFAESDMPALRPIANVIKLSGGEVPEWMLAMPKERRDVQKRRETGAPPKRDSISTAIGANNRYPRKKKFGGQSKRTGNPQRS